MRNLLAILLSSMLFLSGSVGTRDLIITKKGLVLQKRKLDNHYFSIVILDPDCIDLELFWKRTDGSDYRNFSQLEKDVRADNKELLFATNSGIFSADRTPGGLHVENFQKLSGLNLKDGGGNFHMKPNGVFSMGVSGATVLETSQYQQERKKEKVKLATQSGPMLVMENKLHPDFRKGSTNILKRSGVGVNSEGKIVFCISRGAINFYDFANVFKNQLNCPNALYLDGQISEFYAPSLGLRPMVGNFVGILGVVE